MKIFQVSSNGYRTLVYASKIVENPHEIIDQYNHAKIDIQNTDYYLDQLADQIETNLIAYAVSGVEGELQEEIGKTLEKLHRAGIKTWMLTRDRQDTALNIAVDSGITPK
jgi:P-type E1-E2 ATPase